MMRRLVCGLIISAILCMPTLALAAEPKVDSISAASNSYYGGLKGEELLKGIKEKKFAIVVSTVNADGSPNAAVIDVSVADSKTLMFRAANQTGQNVRERKLAVITAYLYDSEKGTNSGARIICKYITDATQVQKLLKQTNAKADTIFMEIVKVLPLG